MILVTGGTGFVGREVVEELLALGHRVRLLVRHPERAASLTRHPRVECVEGDALRPETLPAAMAGVKAVIHLIGIIAETSRVTYEQAHTEATRNVLAAAKQAGVTRWIQMSAIGTRPFARSRYHLTKWQAEELVRQSGLDWTIFRPSLIYGHDERDRLLNLLRRALSWPLDVIQLYSFPLLNGGEALIQPVSVREVARCFALAPAKEAAIGRTYDLVGPIAFSWREMVFKIIAALGKKGVYEEIPILLILRKLLWGATVLLPCLVIAGRATGALGLASGGIGAGLWVALLLTAHRWRRVILYCVPAEPFILAGDAWNAVAPRGLQYSEILKMAVEDNTGDPRPAAETFGYIPESFEEGFSKVAAACP
ncbi:MAG TPA: NAD(P)H-binding protein [Candidatus Methylacidiphilales bacterium]|jgi:NADH dehydrogenase|nr:NAD(P)H-binding protein [Candidatus Methylacidiphilales bacterium]